jgi:hypothetical protein
MRAFLWHDDQVVAEQEHTLNENFYFRNEAERMLKDAGFPDITIRGGYSEREATDEDLMVVFVARK